jgi:hypothetical protein
MSLPETISVSCYVAISTPFDSQSRADTNPDSPWLRDIAVQWLFIR